MKKRIAYAIIAVIAVFVLMSLTVISASAEVVDSGTCGENVTWVLDDSGTITISGLGEMTDFENYTATPWADYRKEIKKAVIEDGVTSVGSHSFNMIRSLTSVSLPESVTAIGKYAFGNCWGLTEIALPEKLVIIGDSAFASSGVVSLDFPATLESVDNLETLAITSYSVAAENPYFSSEDGILYNKEKSTLIAYPTAMKNTSFTIPDSVTVVGRDAFYYNKYLTHIEIGNSVKTIERCAFFGSKIETVDFGESAERIEYSAFGYCNNLSEAYLPDTVTYIDGHAFYPCYSLKEIILPNSELYIGKAAFCSDELTSVFIPEKVKTIEANPFEDCSKLTEIIVDKNNAYFSSVGGVLYDKNQTLLIVYPASKSDTRFSIPGTVESIGSYSFEGVCYLKEITVPDKVSTLVAHTFSGATSLEKIYLPDTIKSIGTGAFSDCSSLKEIKLPSALTSVNSQLFYSCTSLRTLIIPEKVSYVEYSFIQGCTGLEEISFLCSDCRIIPTAYANMGNPVIRGYENSTAKTFAEEYGYKFSVITAGGTFGDGFTWILDGNGVLEISGQGAMPDFTSTSQPWGEYKDSISFASVGNTVTNIGAFAFYDYASLEGVKLEDCTELKKIGNSAFNGCTALENISIPAGLSEIGSFAFVRCTSLESIDVAAENEVFSSENGVLYNISEGEKELTVYPAGKKDKTFSVPDDVTSIGQNAFAYCEYITNIKFSNSSSLRSIRQAAFYRCTALKSFRVPGNVEVIENNVFVMCEKLSAITADAKNKYFTNIGGVLFDKSGETLLIYPAGMREEEYVVPASVKTLAYESFCYCLNLKAVTFEEGSKLSVIKDSAFYNCEELTYLALPDSLHTIEKYAFLDCVKLPFIYIPENVKEIGSYAFLGCQSLKNVVILSRDCRAGYINDSLLPVTFYVYKDSAVIPDLFAQGTIKYIVESDDVYSYEDAVLTMRDLSSVPAGEDPYCYPWTRYMYEAECIIFDNSGTVGANLFSGFSECTVIIINNDSEDEAGTAVFSDGAFSGFSSLKTIVSFSDILITENAFDGGISPTVFCEAERSCRTPFTASVFSYSEGTVSFSEAELSFTDYDFFDLLIAICHIYGDKIVDALYFPDIETVGFAFDDDYMIDDNGILYDKYAEVKIAPMVSYDGLTFERISFNEFCRLAANEDAVLLKMVILDETEPDDEPDGVFVSFGEIMVQVFRTIATLFNKILKALFGLK